MKFLRKIALWILLGIYTNALWADCQLNGNNIECDDVSSGDVNFEIKSSGNILRTKGGGNILKVSGGNLTLNFAPNLTSLTNPPYLYLLITLEIMDGNASINYDAEGKNNGIFEMQNNAELKVSGGIFQSNVVVNRTNSTNGINVSGGTFTAGMLQNGGNLSLTNGALNVGTLENSGIANLKGGKSEIVNLTNYQTLSISGGENTLSYLTNNGTATIGGGTKNKITNLTNSATLTISGGENEIINFRNDNGTATISGGNDNKITNLRNSANLEITNGTNQITTFSNEKGEANISGGANTIAYLYNSANLKIENGTNTITSAFYNYGTTNLSTNLTLESNAKLDNYGTISGSGIISGGIFNHYGSFKDFSGTFSDLTFNNMTNLTISSSGGDLASLNVKSFVNSYNGSNSGLTLESTLETQGFTNGLLANALIKGTLTINGGQTTIKCDDNSANYKCDGNNNKTYEIDLTAQNAGGFFTLESGGKVNSQIDFTNTGYLTINGGEFSVNDKSLKNEGNGSIRLNGGKITGSVQNISGSITMSGGTIENALTNNGNFALSGGTISGAIENIGGTFAIYGGDKTLKNFKNQVQTIENKDKNDSITSTTYKGANLIIYGSANITTLENQSQGGKQSVINIEGGSLESANLTNSGLIQAIRGSLNATTLLNNNGGEIVAYSGGSITAQKFEWGSGIVRYINGNSGTLNLTKIEQISADSKLNMDFSTSPLIFGSEYKVIKTDSSPANLTALTIQSNAQNNLANPTNLTCTKNYKDGYIVISTTLQNQNSPLNALLSPQALATLGDNTAQFDALKRLDSSEILSHIISNPAKVATELRQSNESVATNHTKNSHLNLANSLNTLNRLNKSATPRKLAFSDILRPNYNFAQRNLSAQKPKNPLIKFANFDESNIDSIDSPESNAESESNETYTLEDLKKDYDKEVEAAKLKYNQLIDYANNLYASIFGIFGDFGGLKTNAYGVLAGYDTKITDALIIGANLSYANANKAHNIGVGGYGRAFLQNNEIDFGLNFNYALNDYKTQMFGYTQSATFHSFGFSANVSYGYLFNVYKSQFFKPFGGLNLYYALTPSYLERGKYGRAVDSAHSFEMSVDLGAEYRVFLKRNQYLYAQIRFEQFIANLSNGLNMSFVGDSQKFEFAKYKGYKNYLQFLVGGDFAVIKDTLNVTANVGYKMTIAESSVDSREIAEQYISVSAGIKYLF